MEQKNSRIKLKAHFGKVSAILIAVFAALLTVDLVLKHCEEAYNWNFTVIPHLITVQSGVRNPGAAFSFLANAGWGQIFLIVLTFIALAAMVFAFIVLPERFIILKTSIALIASGALGNLVDRIAFREVRDFVWLNMFGNWACCNFADFWIVFGVILAVIDMLFLNEWAVLPLTKSAKAAQKARTEAKNVQSGLEESAEDTAAENGESAEKTEGEGPKTPPEDDGNEESQL